MRHCHGFLPICAAAFLACACGCAVSRSTPSYSGSTFQILLAGEAKAGAQMSSEALEKEIARLMALKPKRSVPGKVVVLDVSDPSMGGIDNPLKRLRLQTQTGEVVCRALRESGAFEDGVQTLPELLVPELNRERAALSVVRLAAARAQADGVLIYATESGGETLANPLAVLYLTVAGAWIAPGTRRTSLAVSKAAMVDTQTGYIYLIAEGMGEKRVGWRPTGLIDYEEMTLAARLVSVEQLAREAAAKARELARK
jgi:hypothetical protein